MPGMSIRPGSPGYSYAKIAKLQEKHKSQTYALMPRSFVLAWTREKVNIPYTSRLAARVEGKSSLARLGVSVHVTAPIVHAGFNNVIQLEMYNFGQNEVILDAGMWVCQLVFEYTSGTPDKGYSGIFQGT
jgi:dCTP deaminase